MSQKTSHPKIYLAPMAGYTDSAFRRLVKKFSPDLATVSEMISVEGASRGDEKSLRLAHFTSEERPFWVQIFGSQVEPVKKAIEIIEKLNPDGIDLNFACPVKKIIKNKSGGFLLKDQDLALRLAEAAVASTSLPVSVKTRLGFVEDQEILDFAPRLESVGISHLAIHGRTVKELFKNQARWKNIYEVKKKLSIPVYGNGDIRSLDDIDKVRNLDGVFIGRASLGQPWFLANFLSRMGDGGCSTVSSRPYFDFSLKQKMEIAREHLRLCAEGKGEKMALLQMRSHFSFYLRGFPGASECRQKLMRIDTLSEIDEFFKKLKKLT